MATFARRTTSSRAGSKRGTVVVEGADVVADSFTRRADEIRPRAAAVTVAYAGRAAKVMRDLTTSDRVRESITSDDKATSTSAGFYADAGPDHRKSNQAWIARFLEQGTVNHPPRPFVGPAADEVLDPFAAEIRGLT